MGKRNKNSDVSRGRHTAIVRMVLEGLFPKAFKPKGFEKVPLKIGIANDLASALGEALRRWEIGDALGDYTGGPTYLRNMIEDCGGAARQSPRARGCARCG